MVVCPPKLENFHLRAHTATQVATPLPKVAVDGGTRFHVHTHVHNCHTPLPPSLVTGFGAHSSRGVGVAYIAWVMLATLTCWAGEELAQTKSPAVPLGLDRVLVLAWLEHYGGNVL